MFKPDQVYVVHGVNDFDEAAVLATIRDRYGFEKLEAFNWDRTTPSVFPKGNPLMFRFRPFAEIGHGFIRGAHIGFFPPTDNYAGINGAVRIGIHNVLAALLTIACVCSPIFLLAAVRYPLAGLVLAYAVCGTATGQLALGFEGLRRNRLAAFVSLRRVVLPFAWVALWMFTTATYFVIVSLIVFALWFSFSTAEMLSGLSGNYWIFATLAIASTVAWFGFFQLTQHLAGFLPKPLKLVADVARYFGLAQYRARLVEEFRNTVAAPGGEGRSVLIISHSLGTSIVADCLLRHPEAFGDSPTIVWATMGSPINRLFARFFPGSFLSALELGDYIESTFERFRWLNVYRRWDFVGGSLSPLPRCLRERCTGQRRKGPIGSHAGYWGDPIVKKCFLELLSESEDQLVASRTVATTKGTPPKAALWPTRGSVIVSALWRKRGRMAWPFVALLIAVAFTSAFEVDRHLFAYSAQPLLVLSVAIIAVLRPSWWVMCLFGADSSFNPLCANDTGNSQEESKRKWQAVRRAAWMVLPAVVLLIGYYELVTIPRAYRWETVSEGELGGVLTRARFSQDGRALFAVATLCPSSDIVAGVDCRANAQRLLMVDVSSGRTYCSVLRNRGDSILALESRQSPSGAKIARTLELSADGHLAVLDYQVGADCSKPSTIRVEVTRDQGQHAAALDSTGNRLAVLRRNAENARVEFIDLLAPERHQSVSIMAGAKWFVLSSDGQWLASCDLQSELVVTNVATAANISTGIHCPNEVGGRGLQAPVAFGSTVLGAWMWEREFTMFDLFSKESHTIKVPTPRLVAAGLLAFSLSDDGKLFLASDNYGVSVWDVAASHMLTQNLFGLRNLNSRSEPLMPPAVAFSADGRLAAGQDRAEHLQVWRWSESWIMGQLHHLFKEPD